jgi:hypothetical protein
MKQQHNGDEESHLRFPEDIGHRADLPSFSRPLGQCARRIVIDIALANKRDRREDRGAQGRAAIEDPPLAGRVSDKTRNHGSRYVSSVTECGVPPYAAREPPASGEVKRNSVHGGRDKCRG